MATIAPHPARPRTRDDNDPFVIKERARVLAYLQKTRQEKPDEFLRKKREYNERHKADRAAYAKRRYAAKKAAREAAEIGAVVSIM